MTSKRRQARELARWEAATRTWATDTVRDSALALYYDRGTGSGSRPFSVGVVPDEGERVWMTACSSPTPKMRIGPGVRHRHSSNRT